MVKKLHWCALFISISTCSINKPKFLLLICQFILRFSIFVTLGNYTVNITFDDAHVPNSPFTVACQEPVDASKVKCKGPGISNTVRASLPATFTVDATKAGKAPLEVEVDGPGGVKVPVDVKDNEDGTFDVAYVPETKGMNH